MRAVACFAVAGLLFGVVDGWVAAAAAKRAGPMAVLFAAALNGVLGCVLGALFAATERATRWWRAPRDLLQWIGQTGDRQRPDREPVIALHGWLTAGALGLVGFSVVTRWVIGRSWNFEDEGFAVAFSSGVSIAAAVAAVIGVIVAQPLIAAAFRRLDARVRLPLPPWPSLRYAIVIALPVVGLLAPFAVREDALLGARVAAFIWLGCVAVCAPLVGYGLRALDRWPRVGRLTSVACLGLVAVLLAVTVARFEKDRADGKAIERTVGALAGADLVRLVTDVDRDGSSSLLGGGDCASFDGARGPRVREVPGNGVDEDCDGKDGARVERGSLMNEPVWSGALPADQVRPYNIVWLTVDAMRADHVGVLGYERPTTPNFDALSRESLLFRNALSQSSRTFFSVPSMFLGLNPGTIDWVRANKVQQPAETHDSIAEMLSARGYHTGIVLPGGMLKDYTGLQQGFADRVSYFLDDRWKYWRERGAPVATSKAIELVEEWQRDERPFFLAVHYIDPHNPYVAHRDKSYPDFGPRTTTAPENYDDELAYTDRYIGFLLDHLRNKPELWKNTIVVITADHGEEFMEHGRKHHGFSCFLESVHVPLLVRVPELSAKRIDTRVALVDIVPTLLELTGTPTEVELHGQSLLVPALTPRVVAPQRPFFCATASISGRGYLRRSVRVGSLGLHSEATSGAFELFDEETDPRERENLWGRQSESATAKRLVDLLSSTAAGNLKTMY